MVDRLLWLGAAVCWILAFAIVAQRQHVLARKVERLKRRVDALETSRPRAVRSVVTTEGRFTPAQVAGFRARVLRAGG